MYISPSTEKYLDLPIDHYIGKTHAELGYPEEAYSLYEKSIKKVCNTKSVVKIQFDIIKESEVLSFDCIFTPEFNSENSIVSILAHIRDISEEKKILEQLKEAKEKAEAADKIKSEFLATISHEIRTPLNGLMGMLQLSQISDSLDEIREYLQLANYSSDKLLNILNDILDYSKIESSKMKIEKISFNIRETIKKIVLLYSVDAKNKKLKINLNIDSNIPIKLIGDPFKLNQILSNLIQNAIKFTEEGMILISVEKIKINEREIKLKFIVKDTGIGIPKTKIDRLFKSFSQVDNSHTRKYGGTGLGLFISKNLINLMKGDIWVETIEGVGSEFIFTANFELSNKICK